MNTAQQRALEAFKAFMQTQVSKNPEYKDTVSVEVEQSDYGITWVTARTDMTGLPEGNMLRYVAAQYWFVKVGKRGGLEVRMAPRCYDQFIGRRAFGMRFSHTASK
jgi:hypothetical protein